MQLTVAALVRNEAGRFWRSALEAWNSFADLIVVLDDGSDDGTAAIAERAGALTYNRLSHVPAWGAESEARANLFDLALANTEPGDYILIADADMTPARSIKPLLAAEPEAISFYLYDLWDSDHFREDGFWWYGSRSPRVWCIRRPVEPPEGWKWSHEGIHSGHFPLNLRVQVMLAPQEYGLLHYAYSSPELREAKAAQYAAVANLLDANQKAHADSILDPNPKLTKLPFTPKLRLKQPCLTSK